MRELYEETGQIVKDLEFKGLFKVGNIVDNTVKYNPVYFTVIESLQPFIENEETSKIKLWDLNEEIGVIEEIDLKLLDFL